MRTPQEFLNYITINKMYCISAKKYDSVMDFFARILGPSEEVFFVAGTTDISYNDQIIKEFSVVAITQERIIYGPVGKLYQINKNLVENILSDKKGDEGWLAIKIANGGLLSFKTLGSQVNEAQILFRDGLSGVRPSTNVMNNSFIAGGMPQMTEEDEKIKKQRALSQMLISSGFNFDGYTIVKYSGYISGDDAVSIPRSGFFTSKNNCQELTDALVKIRRQALIELKEAAYNLGCNAVVGVDFDYLTIEPEHAGGILGTGSYTVYEPYVICVTANGNAVVIEKND